MSSIVQTATGDMEWDALRREMVAVLVRQGIRTPRIIDAMAALPRHRFIPSDFLNAGAYGDHPSPIGYGQTISQPFIVALMTQMLDPSPGHRVLEIGTGSGYQTAVLAALAGEVFTVERIPELACHAENVLEALGIRNVRCRCADGYEGWRAASPFDRIMVTCAPPDLPGQLIEQLADGGRMVLPAGSMIQRLFVVEKHGTHCTEHAADYVRFVPMLPGSGE